MIKLIARFSLCYVLIPLRLIPEVDIWTEQACLDRILRQHFPKRAPPGANIIHLPPFCICETISHSLRMPCSGEESPRPRNQTSCPNSRTSVRDETRRRFPWCAGQIPNGAMTSVFCPFTSFIVLCRWQTLGNQCRTLPRVYLTGLRLNEIQGSSRPKGISRHLLPIKATEPSQRSLGQRWRYPSRQAEGRAGKGEFRHQPCGRCRASQGAIGAFVVFKWICV
mgnify:CR=1 FL=1